MEIPKSTVEEREGGPRASTMRKQGSYGRLGPALPVLLPIKLELPVGGTQQLPRPRVIAGEARCRPLEVIGQCQREAVLSGLQEIHPCGLSRHARFSGPSQYVQRARLEEPGFPQYL